MKVEEYLETLNTLLQEIHKTKIKEIAKLISTTRAVYTIGNGGSASTASHFAQDLAVGCSELGIKAVCLSDSIPTITALSNDYSYEEVYSKQLKKTGVGVLIAISASGNSLNIIKALRDSDKDLWRVGLTGFDGGILKTLTDLNILVPSYSYEVVEDAHLCICHIIKLLLRGELTL